MTNKEEIMADKKDYYEILGVSKTATDDELKKPLEKSKTMASRCKS